MDSIWKTFAAPLVVTAIGGIVVGVVLSRIQAPDLPAISAHVHWIDASNPFHAIDTKGQGDVEKLFRVL